MIKIFFLLILLNSIIFSSNIDKKIKQNKEILNSSSEKKRLQT